MKKEKKIRIIILAFAVAVGAVSTMVAADISSTNNSSVAGSADDPLVTLSYVTNTLKPQIEADILSAISGADISALIDSINALNSNANSNSNANIPQQTTEPPVMPTTEPVTEPPAVIEPTTVNSQEHYAAPVPVVSIPYEVVELKRWQQIRPSSGSIELIARQGTIAAVITPYPDQGIGDLTTGDELLNNQEVPINHALLIPRADGRAIQILSDVAYVMVRGDYEILD